MSKPIDRRAPRLSPLAALLGALVLSPLTAAAQTSAPAAPAPAGPIERIRMTDGEMTCAQIHAEAGQMDKLMAEAKAAEDKDKTTGTAAGAAGTAADIAGKLGVFGRIGGIGGALLGQAAAQAGAGAVQKSAQESAQQMAERAKQAAARKEQLTAMFLAKECKASDLNAAGKALTASEMQQLTRAASPGTATASASGAAAAPSPASPPPADAAAASGLVERQAAAALSSALPSLTTVGAGGSSVRSVVAKAPRVVVAAYRVAFVDKTGTGASSVGSKSSSWNVSGTVKTHTISQGQSKTLKLELENVNAPLMQAITDRLHADFIEQLKARGLEVLPREALNQSQHFSSRVKFSQPKDGPVYVISPTGDPRNYNVMSASGVPLLFLAADPLGDQGLINLDQLKGLMFSSLDTQAVPLVVQVTVDFAETSTTGRSTWVNRAEVDGRPVISVSAGRGNHVTALHSTNTIMGEWGAAAIDGPVYLDGDYANVRTVDETNNTLNAVSVGLSMLTATPGSINRTERRFFTADPARYSELALKAGMAVNRALVAATK